MQQGIFWIVLVAICFACSFSSAAPLNVHIVAHTHDDVGWLKTVDEYYYGANNSIQYAGVQYIIDTVIQQLLLNPARRFIYVEIAFFMRWWQEQTLETQTIVRDLVRSGRLEFINGGWTMNDEACVFYTDGIDQMTEGHVFLLRNFGIRPTIGWQIDPFGHASAQATLFSQMGFNGFFFARSDYQDYERRNKTRELESIWRSSASLGNRTDIFTHILYDSNYCEPDGFSFQDSNVQPVMWDKRLENYNLDKLADRLVKYAKKAHLSYRSNNVLIPFGCDFQYMDAVMNFKNMDLLIKYINDRSDSYDVKIFYSTPSTYLEYVHSETEITWPLNQNDYFPYRDNPYSVWSGYFTSRSALKGYIRSRSALVMTLSTLLTTSSGVLGDILTPENYEKQNQLAEDQGIVTHHDAVTGTEKQHVADDYAKHLSKGTAAADEVLNEITGKLLAKKGKGAAPAFESCKLLNESICTPTSVLSSGKSVPFLAYNPLGWQRESNFRIPVPSKDVSVVDSNGNVVGSQVYPNTDIQGVFTLAFSATLAPMALKGFVIQPATASNQRAKYSDWYGKPQADITLENNYVKAIFSTSTGRLSSLTNKESGKSIMVDQEIMWWNASAGNNVNSTQTSGAYIFRPNGTHPWNISTDNVATISYTPGPVVQEVFQYWGNWAYQVTRLYQNSHHLEIEASVGPIPIGDDLGKEIITRFTTNLNSASTWYSDSQGREFQKRVRNFRPTYDLNVTEPVALNYVPADTAAYIEDTSAQTRLTVIHDRAGGCGSLNDGQLELMVHRRLLYDDYRGVGEPLNESMQVRTTEYAFVDSTRLSARRQRALTLELNYPAHLFFATGFSGDANSFFANYQTDFRPLSRSLPPNVHLQTLRTLDTGEVILRLDHIFAVGEDPQYSSRVSVDLAGLFVDLSIVDIRETQLTAVAPIGDVRRYTWKVTGEAQSKNGKASQEWYVGKPLASLVIDLDPMDIRTFIVRFLKA